MSEAIQFELVAPTRKLASIPAESVILPAVNGELTAMANHAPLLTLLRPGFVTVQSSTEQRRFAVTGGFVEVSQQSVSVLAEEAMEAELLTDQEIEKRIEAAEALILDSDEANKARLQTYILELRNIAATR